MAAPAAEIDPVLGTDLGDRDFWAQAITRQNSRVKRESYELENAITSVQITDTIKGSSTIEVALFDEEWDLVDSGFFDAQKDGRLDVVDVNYPEGSDFWWRLTQVGVEGARGGADLTLTFMERPACQLMEHHGPLKTARSKKTRAEFIKMLSEIVGKRSHATKIVFVSKELTKKQPIGKADTADSKKKKKSKGINKSENLTMKGAKASPGQIRQAERALDAVQHLNPPELAQIAMLCAGIGESDFSPVVNKLGYGGVFQGQVATGGHYFSKDDTEAEAVAFMTGVKGFQAGGAIALSKREKDPGCIATQVEASGEACDFYGTYKAEAKKILEAYGGASGGSGGSTTKTYYFKVGGRDNPHETYWDAMNRLADEVAWPLFLDGQHLYYDDEMTLIQQMPALVLERNDPFVTRFSCDWDSRHIATECEVDVVIDPFEVRAGQVVKLGDGFGPAASGSTAKPDPLPGRWLIEEIDRQRFELVSTLKLKQPTKPKPEPAPETTSGGGSGGGSQLSGPIRDKIVQVAKNSLTSKTGYRRYSQAGALTDDPTPKPPARSDCSQFVRACYLQAGGPDPGTFTGDQISKGKKTNDPKPGDLLLSASHVELYIGGGKTIGHGSPPIDYDKAGSFTKQGFAFYTYDGLDK